MENYLLNKASGLELTNLPGKEIRIATEAPSNIALVKYWGKRQFQLPQNPSVSFSLTRSKTVMNIKYTYVNKRPGDFIKLFFDGTPKPSFAERIQRYILYVEKFYPFLKHFTLEINTKNTFPHSSGIASSASSMAALALNLCEFEKVLFGENGETRKQFLKKASFFARLASGSASRSVYKGFVIWGESEYVPQATDYYAVPLQENIHPGFLDIHDYILIAGQGTKSVSSSKGHALMEQHPYRNVRYEQAKRNTGRLLQSLHSGDWNGFAATVEEEAMSIHALMVNSPQPYTLMNNNTWNIVHKIRELRRQFHLKWTYTLDAGPNVHLLFPATEKEKTEELLDEHIKQYCVENQIIKDQINI